MYLVSHQELARSQALQQKGFGFGYLALHQETVNITFERTLTTA